MHRTFVIVGHWFSGTTLLSGLMGNLAGVGSPGELQWLIDDHRTECSVHGPSCQFVKQVARPGLSAANLYSRAAEALFCSALVTSDKMPRTIRRFVGPKEATAIVVFKRPEALAASFKRHGSRDTVESAYTAWYPHAAQWCSEYCLDTVFVEYEQLAKNPELVLGRLAHRLELPLPQQCKYPLRGAVDHNIRGNLESLKSKRYKDVSIKLDDRWRTELSDQEKFRIRDSINIQATWEALSEQAL